MPRPIDKYPGALKITIGDEDWGSFAILWQKAWQLQDKAAIFHPLQVTRDKDPIKVDLPEQPFALKWEDDNDAYLLEYCGVREIFVREEYIKLLHAIIKHAVKKDNPNSGSQAGKEDMDVDEGQDFVISDTGDDDVCSPLRDFTLGRSKEVASIIIGNPGIGKTLFLYYVLAICLLARHEVVFQWTYDDVLVFNDKGVFKIDFPFKWLTFSKYLSKGTWFLRDCDMSLGAVPQSYIHVATKVSGLILEAASPRHQNIEWRKKCRGAPRLFWMAPWTLGELLVARGCQLTEIPSELQLASFTAKFGKYPRQTYGFADATETFESRVKSALNTLTETGLEKLLSKACSLELDTEVSHDLIAIQPFPRDPQKFTVQIPTKYLFNIVFTEVKKSDDRAASHLYRVFLKNPLTHYNAGYLLERSVCMQFPKGGEWTITLMKQSARPVQKNVHWHSDNYAAIQYLHIGYRGGPVAISHGSVLNQQEDFSVQPVEYFEMGEALELHNAFFVPSGDNQPSFDAFIYDTTQEWALLFQVTASNRHEIKRGGLDWIRQNGAKIIDVVAVTPPVPDNKYEDIFIDSNAVQLVRNVYHLAIDDVDV